MDLLIPVARIVDLVVSDEAIPWDLTGETCGYLRHRTAVEDFAHAQGRTEKPRKPLMLYGPDNYTPIVIVGDGVTEAAEMQDLALQAIDKQEAQFKKSGRGLDFDDMRERRGLVRREDFDTALKEAFAERAKYLKAHQVTEGLPRREKRNF